MSDTANGGVADLLLGTELAGRYQLIELLGVGGMGAVYKARQLQLDSFVAIKLIRPALGFDTVMLQRLQQEAQVLATLGHPSIPKVHCIERLENGTVFLAMDFIEGHSLQNELKERNRLPAREAVAILLQATDALSHAHQHGIVHRDIKPGNILLSGAADDRSAHILDFGIAKRLDSSQKFTQTGAIIGTVQYISPEQASGINVDHRADIYSLACVFYEMLTGCQLYEGESSVEVLMKHVQETLPPLNTPEIGELPLFWLKLSRRIRTSAFNL